MFLSAFALLRSDPVSQAYYQRKHDQGKPPRARPSSPWPTAAS
ncbi:conserved domain protein [Actinomyces sp. oral taxon 175 str. F0384]|nr:conserved domain protein [Actinomyces sp. oral taxon 175 str. F0384]